MLRRRWHHRTRVFFRDGSWRWSCKKCSGQLKAESLVVAFTRAQTHAFLGGYTRD